MGIRYKRIKICSMFKRLGVCCSHIVMFFFTKSLKIAIKVSKSWNFVQTICYLFCLLFKIDFIFYSFIIIRLSIRKLYHGVSVHVKVLMYYFIRLTLCEIKIIATNELKPTYIKMLYKKYNIYYFRKGFKFV